MREKRARTVTHVLRITPQRSAADLAHVDRTTDADVARQIAEDPDTAPEFTAEMFARAKWVAPLKKVPVALRIDPDVLEFFRKDGPGYQSRMNAVLRSYMLGAQDDRQRDGG
jgi:uncharacterized protein (DUF4415 family)